MADLNERLAELRTLAESKMVKCPEDWEVMSVAVLDMLRFPCSESGGEVCPVALGTSETHVKCNNTGYITRSLEEVIKMLEGVK